MQHRHPQQRQPQRYPTNQPPNTFKIKDLKPYLSSVNACFIVLEKSILFKFKF